MSTSRYRLFRELDLGFRAQGVGFRSDVDILGGQMSMIKLSMCEAST